MTKLEQLVKKKDGCHPQKLFVVGFFMVIIFKKLIRVILGRLSC